jgi:hypothetical protein
MSRIAAISMTSLFGPKPTSGQVMELWGRHFCRQPDFRPVSPLGAGRREFGPTS